jgi:hypothetical protein
MEKNLYKILEISPTASQGEIKKAYKRLAKAVHPDAHQGSAVYEEKFKEINKAYQILKNAETRRDYDRKHSHSFAYPSDSSTRTAPGGSGKKPASDFWTKQQKSKGNDETRQATSAQYARGARESASPKDEPPSRIYREPWSGPEPLTVLKAIVLLTILAPLGIGLSERRAHVAAPAVVVTSGISPAKTARPEGRIKKEETTVKTSSPASETYGQEPALSNLPEQVSYDAQTGDESPRDENLEHARLTKSNQSSDELLGIVAKERALLDEIMNCDASGDAARCFDLANAGIETFTDRSRTGTAYLVRFIMAFNLDKSDRTLDLFYEMMELEEQGKIILSPLYAAQAWPVALNLTIILNDRQNYLALRDNTIRATEAFAQYADDVSETIKTAESVKGWVVH